MRKKYHVGKDNPMYGRKHSEASLLKMRLIKLGENNPFWRGDKAGRGALHDWLKSRKPKTVLCERCGGRPPFDLALTGYKYTRDLNDYQWLCRRCHMEIDGRLDKLIKVSKERKASL